MRLLKSWPPDQVVADLLKLASVPDNPESREFLCEELEEANAEYDYFTAVHHPVPPKAYGKVAKTARLLLAAVSELNRHYKPRLKAWPLGDTDDTDWMEDRQKAENEVRRILMAVEEELESPNREGGPRKYAGYRVVRRAVEYLRTCAPKTRAKDEFIEKFYETATGENDVSGKLEWQIRQARNFKPVKARRRRG